MVLKTFTNISFIIQTKINEINHFMVADYNKNLNDRSKSDELIHYIDYGNPTLNEHKRLDIKSSCLCSTRIMDNVYLTSFCDKEQLYNLKKESKRYDKIFWKNGLMDRFDEKTVLVNEKLYGEGKYDINDLLTYGINPETYEIVTPIWSELQQRSFNVYTDEDRRQLTEKLAKQLQFINKEVSNEKITIYFEVEKYLNIISEQLEPQNSIFVGFPEKINEEFVKKFTKK